jgi:hypothetical protein
MLLHTGLPMLMEALARGAMTTGVGALRFLCTKGTVRYLRNRSDSSRAHSCEAATGSLTGASAAHAISASGSDTWRNAT